MNDFEALGRVEFGDVRGAIPFYGFEYKEYEMHLDDPECGGSCFDFLLNHFDLNWGIKYRKELGKTPEIGTSFPAKICSE